jgi:hypothetical protein
MPRFHISGAVVAAMIAAMIPASANAVTYDKLAYLTFSAPVQIPGATLTPGHLPLQADQSRHQPERSAGAEQRRLKGVCDVPHHP